MSATLVLLALLSFAFHFGGGSTEVLWGLGIGAMVALGASIVLSPRTFLEYSLPTEGIVDELVGIPLAEDARDAIRES